MNNMKEITLNGTIIEYNNFIPSESEWHEIIVRYGEKSYKVLHTEIGNCQLIKPFPDLMKECQYCKETNKGGYHEFEFETLFGFTNHCENFTPNRVINISNAM